MARGRRAASGAGTSAKPHARKPPLAWASDGKSFRIDQEAAGLTDTNIDDWAETLREALDAEIAKRAADPSSSEAVTCSLADFSHNAIGDRGLRTIVNVLAGRKVRIHVLRLFKSQISDSGAEALAKALALLPAPLEELHLPHNRLTASGAVVLLAAAARASGAQSLQPTWLRLENNRIDWDAVAKQLETQKVCWAASESRQAGRGAQATGVSARKKRAAAAAGESPPQVFVHRSYRHQASLTAEDAEKGRAETTQGKAVSRADAAGKAVGNGKRYEREDMLFLRHLIQASQRSLPPSPVGGDAPATKGLRCARVPTPPPLAEPTDSDEAPAAAPAAAAAEAPAAADETGGASPPAVARPAPGLEGQPSTPSKGVQLSLEQYLARDLPPAPERFNFNAKAMEFVPTVGGGASPTKRSPGDDKAKSLNASAVEFTPTRASTVDTAGSLDALIEAGSPGTPATAMSATAAEFTPQGANMSSMANEFTPSPAVVAEAAAAAAAAAVAAATGRAAMGETVDVASIAQLFAFQAASAATVAAAAQLPHLPFEALQRAHTAAAAAAAAAAAGVEAPSSVWAPPAAAAKKQSQAAADKSLNPSAAEFRPQGAELAAAALGGPSAAAATKDGQASRTAKGDGSGSTSAAEEDTSLEEIEEEVRGGCAQS